MREEIAELRQYNSPLEQDIAELKEKHNQLILSDKYSTKTAFRNEVD